MPKIEDFFGNYKFCSQGNTNPLTYPPGEPMSIGPSSTLPGTAILRWVAQGKALFVDQIPFNGQALSGRDLIGRAGNTEYLVNVRIHLLEPAGGENRHEENEETEGKMVTGDLYGESAGPLVGQWGAETPPPPVKYRVSRPLAVQMATP